MSEDDFFDIDNFRKLGLNQKRVFYFISLVMIFNINDEIDIINGEIFELAKDNNYMITLESKIKYMELLLEPKEDYSWEIYTCGFFNYLTNNKPERLLVSNINYFNNIILKDFRGIQLLWLIKYFRLNMFRNKFEQLKDLPIHGYILPSPIGITAEALILADAYVNFSKAEKFLKKNDQLTKSKLIVNLSENEKILNDTYNIQIKSNSTQALINFMTFLECFVNSISYNYILTNNIDIEIKNILSDCYMPTLNKIYFYPKLIKKQQVDECLRDYRENEQYIIDNMKGSNYSNYLKDFLEIKKIRDSYIHFSENPDIKKPKSPIILYPYEWFEKAKLAKKAILGIAKIFWQNCGYDELPYYLYKSDENMYQQAADNIFMKEAYAFSEYFKDLNSKS